MSNMEKDIQAKYWYYFNTAISTLSMITKARWHELRIWYTLYEPSDENLKDHIETEVLHCREYYVISTQILRLEPKFSLVLFSLWRTCILPAPSEFLFKRFHSPRLPFGGGNVSQESKPRRDKEQYTRWLPPLYQSDRRAMGDPEVGPVEFSIHGANKLFEQILQPAV